MKISTSQPLRLNFGLFFGRGGTLKIKRGHMERFWWSWRPWTPKSCQVSFSKWSGLSTRASGGWPPLVTASPEVFSHLARDYWLSWAPTPLPIAETYNQTQVQTGPEEWGRNCYLWGGATHAKRTAWFFFQFINIDKFLYTEKSGEYMCEWNLRVLECET